jgi:hypothetical protein
MTSDPDSGRWPVAFSAGLAFLIAAAGCISGFAIWSQELNAPQVVILGTGDRLSLLVTDGPARLLLATGNEPVEFENALSRVRPLFARRLDIVLVAGDAESLYVPMAVADGQNARQMLTFAPLPPSPESDALGAVPALGDALRIDLGPSVSVTAESAFPIGSDPATDAPSWRVTIEHGGTRIVALSDGPAANLFPPAQPASILVVSGNDPVAGWNLSPAVALVANADLIDGPDIRDTFGAAPRRPEWGYRVFPGEALNLKFVDGGIETPSDTAIDLGSAAPQAATSPDTESG